MDSTTYRGLAFLLSLGTLPVGCKPEGDGGTEGGTEGGTIGATDGAGTTTGAPTTSTGGTTGNSSTDATGGTGDPAGSCAASVEYQKKCDPDGEETEAELYAYCIMIRKRIAAVYGPACLALHEDVDACLATVACDDPDPCPTEIDAANACLPEADAACTAFAAKEAECYGVPVSEYAPGLCQAYINDKAYYFGDGCGAVFEEWYACLSDLPCPEFQMRAGCEAEEAKIDVACGGP